MKKTIVLIILEVLGIIIIAALAVTYGAPKDQPPMQSANSSHSSTMLAITSPAFTHNQSIPSKYTCDGENINPPLMISGVPENAVSLVLIMEDPDVPTTSRPDGMWDHWVIFNMPAQLTQITEGTNPQGVLGANTRGENAYGGPCPPDREHRYFFKAFALDTTLDLPEGSTKAEVEYAMQGHIIEQAELIGLYNRQ